MCFGITMGQLILYPGKMQKAKIGFLFHNADKEWSPVNWSNGYF